MIGKVSEAANFLGCTHEKGTFKLSNGKEVTSMTYNMEPFFRSCEDKYLALARERGFNANMRIVPTPFINEDHAESPQGKPCGDGPTLYCPCCRHAFPQSESLSDKEWRSTLQKLEEAISKPIPAATDASVPPGAWASDAESDREDHGGDTAGGVMGPIAARVLMKLSLL